MDKKELAVAALQHGTVIDHIPSAVVFEVVKILGLESMSNAVTIGANLASKRLGSKGIIKVANVAFDEATINRIALVAPTAVMNIIKDYEVVEKYPVALPEVITGIVRCANPKCITNNEPMQTKFDVISRQPVLIRCRYCNHSEERDQAKII